MWTRPRLSSIMLVKVKYRRRIGLMIPIPVALGVFEEVIEGFEDLVWLHEKIFPVWNKRIKQLIQESIESSIPLENVSLTLPFQLMKEFLFELRKHGRWQMVGVDAEDIKVKVEFF